MSPIRTLAVSTQPIQMCDHILLSYSQYYHRFVQHMIHLIEVHIALQCPTRTMMFDYRLDTVINIVAHFCREFRWTHIQSLNINQYWSNWPNNQLTITNRIGYLSILHITLDNRSIRHRSRLIDCHQCTVWINAIWIDFSNRTNIQHKHQLIIS